MSHARHRQVMAVPSLIRTGAVIGGGVRLLLEPTQRSTVGSRDCTAAVGTDAAGAAREEAQPSRERGDLAMGAPLWLWPTRKEEVEGVQRGGGTARDVVGAASGMARRRRRCGARQGEAGQIRRWGLAPAVTALQEVAGVATQPDALPERSGREELLEGR